MKKIFILTIIGLIFSVSAYPDTIKNVSFETIDQGAWSKYQENNDQQIIEIYDQKGWEDFWNKHTSGKFPAPGVPEINFRKYLVIVALDQIRNSSGYKLKIKNIVVDTALENRLFEISIEVTFPGSAAITADVLTRPFHIVKVEKSNL